ERVAHVPGNEVDGYARRNLDAVVAVVRDPRRDGLDDLEALRRLLNAQHAGFDQQVRIDWVAELALETADLDRFVRERRARAHTREGASDRGRQNVGRIQRERARRVVIIEAEMDERC